MRIAVVGTGSLGGYFGGRLAHAGEEVHFLARGRTLAALLVSGLRVGSVFGDFEVAPNQVRATDDPTAIGPVEIVLFTVKSFDTEAAAASLQPLLGPDTAVISLQNGIDNEERLARSLGADRIVGGAAYIFANVVAPGIVRHSGGPGRIVIGELDGRASRRLDAFRTACERAGIPAEVTPRIRSVLWTKYAFICAQAGVTAATRRPLGVIRETPATWRLFRQVLEEVESVARAEGVDLPDDTLERGVALAESLEPGVYSSLHDDLVAGRRTELEQLLGELVRRARAADVAVPAVAALHAVLVPQVRGGRPDVAGAEETAR